MTLSELLLHRVSRSETSGMIPSNQGPSVQTVAEYNKELLVCEESELCFEEVRAEKYLREKQERELRENSKSEVPKFNCSRIRSL